MARLACGKQPYSLPGGSWMSNQGVWVPGPELVGQCLPASLLGLPGKFPDIWAGNAGKSFPPAAEAPAPRTASLLPTLCPPTQMTIVRSFCTALIPQQWCMWVLFIFHKACSAPSLPLWVPINKKDDQWLPDTHREGSGHKTYLLKICALPGLAPCPQLPPHLSTLFHTKLLDAFPLISSALCCSQDSSCGFHRYCSRTVQLDHQ